MVDSHILKQVIDSILQVGKPDKIILFGSAAKSAMTPDSDLDLLILHNKLSNAREEIRRLRKALLGIPLPIDVMVMTTGRFEETKNIIGGIAFPANKYGRVIYEAA